MGSHTKVNGQTLSQTPSHQGFSPDPNAQTPATPSDTAADPSTDPDAYLSDIADETWGIILSHRPVLSPAPDDYQISLSSALLMKLPPQSPTTNPFNDSELVSSTKVNCIAVHLHWARHSGKGAAAADGGGTLTGAGTMSALPKASTDTILREYLGMFRNLALLAKVRGMGDWKAGLIPWHVLAAMRAAHGLDRVYGSQRWADC
jgi:mediator of RNA polymerase II transcription subunit 13, fungi type